MPTTRNDRVPCKIAEMQACLNCLWMDDRTREKNNIGKRETDKQKEATVDAPSTLHAALALGS